MHISKIICTFARNFLNGNKIVNQYNAAGQKCKTEVYTTATPKSASNSALAFCEFETDSVDYVITEHFGSVSQCTTPHGSTQHISNSIGFYCSTDDQFYHYVKDHIGNVRVVVKSATGEAVQSTQYYASGVPMIPEGEQRDKSSYMYNGKEFVETPSNEYNVYDYGFRGYYATIGRFTSMDPLGEQTPWQSPYAYAGNNFVNCIDYMGLMKVGPTTFTHAGGSFGPEITDIFGGGLVGGITITDEDFWEAWLQREGIDLFSYHDSFGGGGGGFGITTMSGLGTGILGGGPQVLNYIVINSRGEKIGGEDDGDNSIYLSESGEWTKDMGKKGLEKVGTMFPWWCGIDYYGMPNGRLVPGLYDGQFFTSVTISIGVQVYVPTPIGDIGINVVSWDAVSLSKNMKTGEKTFDWFGHNGEARINTLQFSVLGAGFKYSIKHELLGDMRYVAGSNTSSVHAFGCFSLGIDGSFSLSFSLGIGIMTTWSITGYAYYGQH